MKQRPKSATIWPGLALSLACFSGCFHWQPVSELEPGPALQAKARMEFAENQVNRDSLVDIVVGARISHALPGRIYHVSAEVEFAGQARGKGFNEVHAARDTVMEFSWRFTEEVAGLRGVTLRAALKVDSVELARDSATYY